METVQSQRDEVTALHPSVQIQQRSRNDGWWQAKDGRWYAPNFLLNPEDDPRPLLLENEASDYLRNKSMRQLRRLSKASSTPSHHLALLVRHGDGEIRYWVAVNSNADSETLHYLSMDEDDRVRNAAISAIDGRRRMNEQAGSTAEPHGILGPFLVLNGAGWAPEIGSRGMLRLYSDHIELGSIGHISEVRLTSLRDIEIEGQSVTSGGGYFGGGFGVKGAAEGMLAAAVLNSLTTKRHKWVTIRIVAQGGWVEIRLDNYDILPVRNILRSLSDCVIANRSPNEPSTQSDQIATEHQLDLASQLKELAELHRSGALTDKEFVAAKHRLLGP